MYCLVSDAGAQQFNTTLLHLLNRAIFMCVLISLWPLNMSTSLCLGMCEFMSASPWLLFDGRCFSFLSVCVSFCLFYLLSLLLLLRYVWFCILFKIWSFNSLWCKLYQAVFVVFVCVHLLTSYFRYHLFLYLFSSHLNPQMLGVSLRQEHWSSTTSCPKQLQEPVGTQRSWRTSWCHMKWI